jgi:hypothetical protein
MSKRAISKRAISKRAVSKSIRVAIRATIRAAKSS